MTWPNHCMKNAWIDQPCVYWVQEGPAAAAAEDEEEDERVGGPSEIDGNLSIAAFLSQPQKYGGLGRSSMNGCVRICRWRQVRAWLGRREGSEKLCATVLHGMHDDETSAFPVLC